MFTHAGQSYGARDAQEVEAIAAVETSAVVDAALATRAAGDPDRDRECGVHADGTVPRQRVGADRDAARHVRLLRRPAGGARHHRSGSCALSVAATVVSRPAADRAVIDAGSKTFGLDRGAHSSSPLKDFGRVIDADGRAGPPVRGARRPRICPPIPPIAVGDRIRIVPNHVCSVSNLGRQFYGLRGRSWKRSSRSRRRAGSTERPVG